MSQDRALSLPRSTFPRPRPVPVLRTAMALLDLAWRRTPMLGLTLGLAIGAAVIPAIGDELRAQPPVTANAPVAPEAVYVGSGGATPGVRVIDLNGFGQGTGALATSRFPFNPNVGVSPGVWPPLNPGTSSRDAGGAGVMTLTRDQFGSDLLLGPPVAADVVDLQLGQPLDLIFNNENVNPFTQAPNQVNPVTLQPQRGNTIMVAPHPNPPRLVSPMPNPARFIYSEEPTVTTSGVVPGCVTTSAPPCVVSPQNRLGIGNPFATGPGLGLFGVNFEHVFFGPQPPPPLPPPPLPFAPFTSRQQVGHFLYALDRGNRQVVVLNSNNFLVLLRIPLPDPVSMAVSPNLRLLAVSNRSSGTVSFIDIDPLSPTTHRVLGSIPVPAGPSGLAWQPEGEDLLVCCTAANTLAIISAATFTVRLTTTRFLNAPIDVAVSGRQNGFGFDTRNWFGYVLNGNGTVAVFESGPMPVGRDDMVTVPAIVFRNATAIQPDLGSLDSACWITHVDANGLAQVSRLALVAGPHGPVPHPSLWNPAIGLPVARTWAVTARYGGSNPTTPVRDLFAGNAIVDLAFDDIRNLGAWPDAPSLFVQLPLPRAPHSGKGQVKLTPAGPRATHEPRFMFVGLRDTARVDVIELATGSKIASLSTPGVQCLAHYWRQ